MPVTVTTMNDVVPAKRRRIDNQREWLEVSEAFNGLKGQVQQVRLFLDRVVTPERGVSVKDTVETLLPSTLDDWHLLKSAAAQFVDAVDGVATSSPDDEVNVSVLLSDILEKSRLMLAPVEIVWMANDGGNRVSNVTAMLESTMQECVDTLCSITNWAAQACSLCDIDVDGVHQSDGSRRLATLDDGDGDDDDDGDDNDGDGGVLDDEHLLSEQEIKEIEAVRRDCEFIVLDGEDEDDESFGADEHSLSDDDYDYTSAESGDDESESDDDSVAPIDGAQ